MLEILKNPHETLRKKSQEVEQIDDEIKNLTHQMLDTMYKAKGCGLAAPQVGVLKRIIVMDLSHEIPNSLYIMINPKIVWQSKKKNKFEEGCLSVPKEFYEIERPEIVHVQYFDENGRMREKKATELMASCVQHEIDHLNGVLIVDY